MPGAGLRTSASVTGLPSTSVRTAAQGSGGSRWSPKLNPVRASGLNDCCLNGPKSPAMLPTTQFAPLRKSCAMVR